MQPLKMPTFNSSDSEVESCAFVFVEEKALAIALITSVRETLKIEDITGAADDVSVPFGMYRRDLLRFFLTPHKFIYKDWEHLKCPFAVWKRFAICSPF